MTDRWPEKDAARRACTSALARATARRARATPALVRATVQLTACCTHRAQNSTRTRTIMGVMAASPTSRSRASLMAPFYIACFHGQHLRLRPRADGRDARDHARHAGGDGARGDQAAHGRDVLRLRAATWRSPRSSTRCRPTRPSSSSRTWCSRCSCSRLPVLVLFFNEGMMGVTGAGQYAVMNGLAACIGLYNYAVSERTEARARAREREQPADVLSTQCASATVRGHWDRRRERARTGGRWGAANAREGADLDDAGGRSFEPLTKRRPSRASAPGSSRVCVVREGAQDGAVVDVEERTVLSSEPESACWLSGSATRAVTATACSSTVFSRVPSRSHTRTVLSCACR